MEGHVSISPLKDNESCQPTQAILLTSSYCIDPMQLGDQNQVRTALLGLKNCRFREVDGVSEVEFRNELFSVSKHKGKYPQLFIHRFSKEQYYQKSTIIFVGLWAQIEKLIENDAIIIEKELPDYKDLPVDDIKGLKDVLIECFEDCE
mmetsp:Transcript_17094/g.20122  ORF Transcript_17094/g.20122 Transcript_17094/m.20122 type:complete len:148 (-) Transcript_17094:205-648(-)